MIVITTPTGNIGHQVLDNVLADDQPVRVIVRDPAKLPADVRDRVEVIQGSHGDPQVVTRAFDGADAVFWLLPTDNRAASVDAAYVGFTRPAAEAMRSRRVKRVVAVSALGRGTAYASRAGHVTASLAMDDLIASTGVAFRALTMPSFMDNLLRQTRAIKEQMAAVISEVLGTPVRFRQIPVQAFSDQLTGYGISPAMTKGLLNMMIAKDNGIARTSQNAIDAPTTFRQWCEDVLKPAVQAA